MEYYNIDQVVDTEASKNTTMIGLDIFNAKLNSDGYYDGYLYTVELSNEHKYLQVETSGIKDEVTAGVQQKMLMPTDIALLESIISKDRTLTKEDKAILKELNGWLKQYQNSLRDSAKSRFEYFKRVIKDDKGKLDTADIYEIISKSLEEQGMPDYLLTYFKVDPLTKEPYFNSNFPQIRPMLLYYIFSAYSNNVIDEKVAGKKYILESAWNNRVIYNLETGDIVRNDMIREQPELYLNDDGSLKEMYSTRDLNIKEEDIDGIKHYTVEVKIPMPLFENEQEKEFLLII